MGAGLISRAGVCTYLYTRLAPIFGPRVELVGDSDAANTRPIASGEASRAIDLRYIQQLCLNVRKKRAKAGGQCFG